MKPSIVVVVVALLLAGCGRAKPATDAAPEEKAVPIVQAAPVTTGPVEQTLALTGTLVARREDQAALNAPVAGVLEEIPIHVGDRVRRGDRVARLSTRPVGGQVTQAQAALAQNQVQVQQARINAQQQQAQSRANVLQAEAMLSAARATLAGSEATLAGDRAAVTAARQALGRAQAGAREGLVAQKDVESAVLALRNAEAQAAAQQRAVDAQRETVRGQEQAVAAAQAAKLQNQVKEADVRVAEQGVRSARGALSNAEGQLGLYTIEAPLDGTVLSVGAGPGETVDTTTRLAVVANLDVLQLQMAVPGRHAGEVHVGQTVRFRVDGQPGKAYEAKIRTLGSQVDASSDTVTALAWVPNRDRALASGTFARCEVVVERRPAVVLVPAAALLAGEQAGTSQVMVLEKDMTAKLTGVKVGVRGGHQVEITSGLHPGQQVLVKGHFGLADGIKVELEHAARGEP